LHRFVVTDWLLMIDRRLVIAASSVAPKAGVCPYW
jgi:hypothetical protein